MASRVPGAVGKSWLPTLPVSKPIVEEHPRTLAYPRLRLGDSEVRALAEDEVLAFVQTVTVKRRPSPLKEDPEEDKFLERAVAGKARFVVSGPAHLLAIGAQGRIQRITPGDLLPNLQGDGRGTLSSGLNVFGERFPLLDDRIPNLVFVRASRLAAIGEDGIRGGPPDTVVEIRSPGDEALEKRPFHARSGVEEVIVIERDSRRVAIHRLEAPGKSTATSARRAPPAGCAEGSM